MVEGPVRLLEHRRAFAPFPPIVIAGRRTGVLGKPGCGDQPIEPMAVGSIATAGR